MKYDEEGLAAEFHDIYQQEARRQGDVRHADEYADLPENVKEFDRVLARYVLAEAERLREQDDRTSRSYILLRTERDDLVVKVERLRAALETIKALADEDAPADYYELARAALAKEGS